MLTEWLSLICVVFCACCMDLDNGCILHLWRSVRAGSMSVWYDDLASTAVTMPTKKSAFLYASMALQKDECDLPCPGIQ